MMTMMMRLRLLGQKGRISRYVECCLLNLRVLRILVLSHNVLWSAG